MRQRLPIALSGAALIVALLGTTSLGEAARRGVARGVRAAAPFKSSSEARVSGPSTRGSRGPRGRRGPRGLRGARGFPGPPGDKGDPGPATDAYEVRSAAPVTITGTTSGTANAVLDMSALPAGNYLFTAELTAEGSGDGRLVCEGRAPGPTGAYFGTAKARIGDAVGATRAASLSIVFGAPLANPGAAQVRCWEEDGTSNDPIVTAAALTGVRASTLTRS